MSSATLIRDLDIAPAPLRLHKRVDASSMTFLYRGQTQLQVITALYRALYAPGARSTRVWLVFSEIEVLATFLACTYMLNRKRRVGTLWLVRRRDSTYGKFLVANAVFLLVVGVATYLGAWAIIAGVIIEAAFAKTGALDWWWFIPAPWWPLVVSAYGSIHGFTLGCSPRSPLSLFGSSSLSPAHAKSWLYLPIPKSSMLANLSLIIPCVLFTINTIFLVTMSGRAHYSARSLRTQILPHDIDELIRILAKQGQVSFATQEQPASDELVWAARRVAAAYFESHRYTCLNLIVYAAAAMALFVPCVIYGLPNLVSLVDHACARYASPLPAYCTNVFSKTHFLLTTARPSSNNISAQLNVSTWKMTMLSICYMLILIVCVPSFASLPILIVGLSWPHQVAQGDISKTIKIAIILVSTISILSCTFVAIFCTVATLDPLFRAAIGLNAIRTQIPIDITVVQHKSQHEEDQEEDEEQEEQEQDGRLCQELKLSGKHEIKAQPSNSTLRTAETKSRDADIDLKKHHYTVVAFA